MTAAKPWLRDQAALDAKIAKLEATNVRCGDCVGGGREVKPRKPLTVNGVTQDDRIAFGTVSVFAVPTAIIAGRFMAGDTVDELAVDYDMVTPHIDAALRYEMCRRSRSKQHAWARELHARAMAWRGGK